VKQLNMAYCFTVMGARPLAEEPTSPAQVSHQDNVTSIDGEILEKRVSTVYLPVVLHKFDESDLEEYRAKVHKEIDNTIDHYIDVLGTPGINKKKD